MPETAAPVIRGVARGLVPTTTDPILAAIGAAFPPYRRALNALAPEATPKTLTILVTLDHRTGGPYSVIVRFEGREERFGR